MLFPVDGRGVFAPIEIGIVGFILAENVEDGGKKHSGDSNNGFLMAAALFDRQIAISDFRMLVGFDHSIGALNQKRLNVGPSSADPA